jgi:hypothetical protein
MRDTKAESVFTLGPIERRPLDVFHQQTFPNNGDFVIRQAVPGVVAALPAFEGDSYFVGCSGRGNESSNGGQDSKDRQKRREAIPDVVGALHFCATSFWLEVWV